MNSPYLNYHQKKTIPVLSRYYFLLVVLLSLSTLTSIANNSCDKAVVKVQILGSGGPELTPNRASSSYLVWLNNKAIVLIDAGAGAALRFSESKANWSDLEVLLISHFHADHSTDLPALIKASWFGGRTQDLPIFGPYGNHIMPSTKEFMQALFSKDTGAYRYLSDMYDDENSEEYKMIAHVIADQVDTQEIFKNNHLAIQAHQVKHGPIPAFAYVVQVCNKTLVFSGDTTGEGFENLKLEKTDVFIAHNAIPQHAGPIAKSLHMTPKQMGQLAVHLNTKKLILSHRMNRSLGHESETELNIRKAYQGFILYANDLDVFDVK